MLWRMEGSQRTRIRDLFKETRFLAGSEGSQRDGQKLKHLAAVLQDERPRALLPTDQGSLLLTDQRLVELLPHLEASGAYNVMAFQGYAMARFFKVDTFRDVSYRRNALDPVIVKTADGGEKIIPQEEGILRIRFGDEAVEFRLGPTQMRAGGDEGLREFESILKESSGHAQAV